MSERNGGPCPLCKGHGQVHVFVEWLGTEILDMCGSCDGTGFWGGAFPPSPEYLAYLERMKLI